MDNFKMLHNAAKPDDGQDMDAIIPAIVFAKFVNQDAALRYAIKHSAHDGMITTPPAQPAVPLVEFEVWWNSLASKWEEPGAKVAAWQAWEFAKRTPPAAPVQEPKQCGLCGEAQPFTGTCGGGRDNPKALCYTPPAAQPAVQEPVGVIAIDNTGFPSLMVRWSHNAYFLGAKVGANLYLGPQPADQGQSCYCPNCEAMGKELAALKAQPATAKDNHAAFKQYLKDRDKHMVDTDVASAFNFAWSAAAAQPAVPLTDEALEAVIGDWSCLSWGDRIGEVRRIARAIEAAHGITAAPEKGGAA
jgi:hypothetical protein